MFKMQLSRECKTEITGLQSQAREALVKVTLEKVNHGKLKFTMVNSTASVTANFQFTMVNLSLVSCPDNSGKNKVDLTPDNNLVTKKKEMGTSLVYLNHAYFVVSLSSFWTNPVITIHLWIHIL